VTEELQPKIDRKVQFGHARRGKVETLRQDDDKECNFKAGIYYVSLFFQRRNLLALRNEDVSSARDFFLFIKVVDVSLSLGQGGGAFLPYLVHIRLP
jgi:hypothetical protein